MADGVKAHIESTLCAAFAPCTVHVEDESHLHAGHAGARPEGETHFRIHITSDLFLGRSRLQRHRMVNQVLAELLETRIHALAIHASPPAAPTQQPDRLSDTQENTC